jgi:hypothetical protein
MEILGLSVLPLL